MANSFFKNSKSVVAAKIDICGISKQFGEQNVLKNINISINPGEIFVLMGPSGSGKSVLLKLIAGLDEPTAGDVLIDGISIKEVKKQKNYVIALVFQSGALFNSMSVFDNLALYLREHRLYNERDIFSRVETMLEMLSLKDAKDKMPADLSGGMKKRVALARGLLMEPNILLFDEPTSELDPITSASIIELIGYVSSTLKITTFIVSHDVMLSQNIGHRVGLLYNGNLEEVNSPEKLFASSNNYVRKFINPSINLKNPSFLV